MARPERFELPTTWFVARYSIQLSYGRVFDCIAAEGTGQARGGIIPERASWVKEKRLKAR